MSQNSIENELLAIYEISKAVNSTLDLDEVLDIIIRETLVLFSAEAGSIMLEGPEGVLSIRAQSGLADEIVKKTLVRPGEGIAGWVYQTGEVLLLDGKVSDPRFKKLIDRKEDISSSLAAPLKSRGRVIGVLMIRRHSPEPYTEQARGLITLIADQAAIAIENASLFEKVVERSQKLEMLNADLSREKLKIETILSSMADGVVVTDPGGEIILVNLAACRILQNPAEKLIGSRFNDFFAGKCNFEDIYDSIFRRSIRYKTEISLMRDGSELNFRVVATGMRRAGCDPEGVVVVIQNITEMKRIDNMKTEFVSMVSHELRTPLTSIRGFAELMMMKEFPKERRDHYLNIILKDSSRLMRLIDNLLDLSKLESGQITLNLEPVKIDEFIPEILVSFESQKSPHRIIFRSEGNVPMLMLDRDMFSNVITNLVSNAVKYSPGGGEINITVSVEDAKVKVSVRDQGIGLAPEMQEKVFDKFFRVDSSLTRETSGTGLGLATVKYIVEGFGGKIWVESEIGKGSNFIFTLPLEDWKRG